MVSPAYYTELLFLQQFPSVRLLPVLYSFVSSMLVCWESYFPFLAFCGWGYGGCGRLVHTCLSWLLGVYFLLDLGSLHPHRSSAHLCSCLVASLAAVSGFFGMLLEHLSFRLLTHFCLSVPGSWSHLHSPLRHYRFHSTLVSRYSKSTWNSNLEWLFSRGWCMNPNWQTMCTTVWPCR